MKGLNLPITLIWVLRVKEWLGFKLDSSEEFFEGFFLIMRALLFDID